MRLLRCAVLAALSLLVVSCTSGGGLVDELKVVNDTTYDLEVRVTDADRDGWVPLGRTRSGETSTHYRVSDVGPVWIFRFEYPGRNDGPEVRMSRDDLAADDWTVRVPETVERALRSDGVEPSGRR